MKAKNCVCGFSITQDEEIELNFGVIHFSEVNYCPNDGNELVEKEVEEE